MRKEKKPTGSKKINRDEDDFFNDFLPVDITGNRFRFIDEFEEQFRRMEQQMSQLYQRMLQGNLNKDSNENVQYYGWTYKLGPDGKPHIREFGNIPQLYNDSPTQITDVRKPHIDVQESDTEIYITAEFPGIDKHDINIETTETTVILEVKNEKHPYYQEIPLPTKINENKADATYNNGILSITLKKSKPRKKGKKININ